MNKTKEEVLQPHISTYQSDNGESDFDFIWPENASKAMEEYASQFKPTLLTEDKEGEGQGDGWVSVDERLPEKAFKDVLVYSRLGIVGLGFYDSEFLRMNSNQSHIGNITHWMPLPKPPIK